MAFPSIAATNTSTDSSPDDHDVSLPSGIVSGNLLIAIVDFPFGPSTASVSWPAGWTKIVETTTGDNITTSVYFRVADGTEGATVVVTANTFPSTKSSIHTTYRITGHDSTANPPEGAGIDGGDTAPNPPNLTPTGGAEDFLWLASMYKRTTTALTNQPNNYTDLINHTHGNGRQATMERDLNAASENPTTYDSNNATSWVAVTLAIHPDQTATAALTGTITDDDEQDIRTGGSTIILTLTNDTWVAAGGAFDAERQGIIDGIDSAQSEANGWDAKARPVIPVANVVRTSGTVVTITMPVVAAYDITVNETITATIPASALVTTSSALIASPTFTITFTTVDVVLSGTITDDGEQDIRDGGSTIILTVSGDTWVASGSTFDAQRQNIINGIDSAQSEVDGWDAKARPAIGVTDVVRTSSTVVTITMPAVALYNISSDETITATVPATALVAATAIIAAPSFNITALGGNFPTVLGTTCSFFVHDFSGNHPVNLPSGIVNGNLLIVAFGTNTITGTITFPAGWTLIIDGTASVVERQVIYFRNADGTEGSTITVTHSDINADSSTVAYRISGNDSTIAPEVSQANSVGGSTAPDSPSLTPTGGAKNYLWLSMHSRNDDTNSTQPTGYVFKIECKFSSTASASVQKALNAVSEDPPAWSLDGVDHWVAATVAIHPGDDFPSAVITGTVGNGATETEIQNDGGTVIITLTGDTWVAAGATFDAQRQLIINGMTATGIQTAGWNSEVRDALAVSAVVRTSDTVVTITLPIFPGYSISANETVTVTVPASALVGASPIVATPDIIIIAISGSVGQEVTVTSVDGTVTEVISADLRDLRWSRGREEELEFAPAGTLEIRVADDTQKYVPENTSSPFFGLLIPGTTITVRFSFDGDVFTLFTGKLDRVVPHPNRNQRDAYIYAADGIDWLSRAEASVALQQSRRSDLAVGDILDAVSWPTLDRSLEAGQASLSVTPWFREKALTAIHEVETVEQGFFYIDEFGKAVLEDRHFRHSETRSNTSQTTITDALIFDIEYEFSTRSLYNEVVADHVNFEGPGTTGELTKLFNENPSIPFNESRTFWLEFEDIASNVLIPVVGTDVQGGSSAGGSDLNGDLAVTATIYAKGIEVTFTNNNSSTPMFLSLPGDTTDAFKVRGDPFTEHPTAKIVAADSSSQTKYQIRSLSIGGKYFSDTNDADGVVKKILARRRDPQALVRVTLRNKNDALRTQMFTRKISDRITMNITDLSINSGFYIEKMEHRIWGAGLFHETIWTLTRAQEEGDYWILDVSKLGINTRLF